MILWNLLTCKKLQFGSEIETVTQREKVKPAQLADEIDESKQVITNWINRGISRKGLEKVSQDLKCDLNWLMSGEWDAFLEKYHAIPFVKSANIEKWVVENNEELVERHLPSLIKVGSRGFFTEVLGSSMTPDFNDGDFILVDIEDENIVDIKDKKVNNFFILIEDPSPSTDSQEIATGRDNKYSWSAMPIGLMSYRMPSEPKYWRLLM